MAIKKARKPRTKNENPARKVSRDKILARMPRRPSLFWDVDPKTVNYKKHAVYIIERILDFGNDREVKWMWHAYPRNLISEIVNKSRVLRPRTKTLWKAILQ